MLVRTIMFRNPIMAVSATTVWLSDYCNDWQTFEGELLSIKTSSITLLQLVYK